MNSIDLSRLSSSRRAALRHRIAPHLAPILDAVENHGVGVFLALQGGAPFSIPVFDGPLVFVIGDDCERALGPDGFDKASILALARRVRRGAVVSCAPLKEIYRAAARTAALLRIDVVIVETQPDQEFPWIEFLQNASPNIGLVVGTVAGGCKPTSTSRAGEQ